MKIIINVNGQFEKYPFQKINLSNQNIPFEKKKNFQIMMYPSLHKDAQIYAEEHGKSLSRLISELLEKEVN